MNNYRGTYVEINLKNIKSNVEKLVDKYSEYKYHIGVVKADSYGHTKIEVVKNIIDGGCNYLAVSSLEEALEIRKDLDSDIIPILCLGYIDGIYVNECIKNNITLTITSDKHLNEVLENINESNKLKVHIKLDTGMNRLGIKTKEEFMDTYETINRNNNHIILEGIYTHIYEASNKKNIDKQLEKFEYITSNIDLSSIEIVHIAQSLTLENYPKIKYANGCRYGIVMYGFADNNDIKLKSTFSVYSKVIQTKEIVKGETVGYDGEYVALENEKIAIVAIGYADGVLKSYTKGYVYINDKRYQIIGNICMDMLMIKIDDTVKINDNVIVIKDVKHIKEIAKHLNTIPYEIICTLGKRVPRIYK